MIYNFDNLSFRILSVETINHRQGSFQVKPRAFAALGYRVCGETEFEVQGKKLSSKPGDIIFIPDNVPYNAVYTDGTSFVIHMLDCNYTEVENISSQSSAALHRMFGDLEEAWKAGCSANCAKAMVYNILDEIEKISGDGGKDRDFLACESYIREHFSEPGLNIDTVCNKGFMSKSSLWRKFYKYYNMSPKQYILKLRTDKALALLLTGELTVKEISALCGFRDEKYFSRVIKEKCGMSPSAVSGRLKI